MTAKRWKLIVPIVLGVTLLALIPRGCQDTDSISVTPWTPPADHVVVAVIDDVLVYLDYTELVRKSRPFDPNEPAFLVPIYAERSGSDQQRVQIFGAVSEGDCGRWAFMNAWVLPAPKVLGEAGDGAIRLSLVSEHGCVRILELDLGAGTVESLGAVDAWHELASRESFLEDSKIINGSTVVLGSSPIGGDEYHLRIIDFDEGGASRIQTVAVPPWLALFDLGEDGYLGIPGGPGLGYQLRRGDSGHWEVIELMGDRIDPCYRGDIWPILTARGSEPVLFSGTGRSWLRIACQDVAPPDFDWSKEILGWCLRDSAEVHLLLPSGSIVRWEEANDGAWVAAFPIPDDFREFIASRRGYLEMGTTHADGEFWFARGKERVALMRVDLDGDEAPEWEWLVNE